MVSGLVRVAGLSIIHTGGLAVLVVESLFQATGQKVNWKLTAAKRGLKLGESEWPFGEVEGD